MPEARQAEDGDIKENYQICDAWWQTAAGVLGFDSDQFAGMAMFN